MYGILPSNGNQMARNNILFLILRSEKYINQEEKPPQNTHTCLWLWTVANTLKEKKL